MSTAAHQDPRIIDRATQTLAWMKDVCPSLRYAALLTDDGFEVASLSGGVSDGSRMASMSSSVQALSDAVARELRIGLADYVVIASSQGHVIQRRVPDHPIVIAALFDTYETLGKALSIARSGAERMAAPLEEFPPVSALPAPVPGSAVLGDVPAPPVPLPGPAPVVYPAASASYA